MSSYLTIYDFVCCIAFAMYISVYSGIPQRFAMYLFKKGIRYTEWSEFKSDMSGVQVKRTPRTLKPFDCSLCLSFWVCLIFILIPFSRPIIQVCGICSMAGITSLLIKSIHDAINRK